MPPPAAIVASASPTIRRWMLRSLVLLAVVATGDALRQLILGRMTHGGFLQEELSVAALATALAIGLRDGGFPARRRPLVVGLLTLAVLLSNGLQIGSSDNFPADALPFRIVREGTVNFDRFPCFTWPERYLRESFGHQVSQYPLTVGILAVPVYLPAALGKFDPCAHDGMYHLAKVAGAVLTSIGAALMYETFAALVGPALGSLGVLVYVLGTAVLSLLGQSLFQHTGAVLGLSLAALGLFGKPGRAAPWFVGFGASLAVASRSFDVFVASGFVIAYLVERPRDFWRVAIAGLLPVGAVIAYQLGTFGSPFSTGYGSDAVDGWRGDWLEGFFGQLLSPGRGLFVFSPVLLLGLGSFFRRDAAGRALRIVGAGALLHVVVMAKWWAWHGAWCNSSRMVSDTLPVFAVALILALPQLVASRRGRAAFAALAVLSVLPHAVVTFHDHDPEFRRLVYDHEEGLWTPRSYPPAAAVIAAARRQP